MRVRFYTQKAGEAVPLAEYVLLSVPALGDVVRLDDKAWEVVFRWWDLDSQPESVGIGLKAADMDAGRPGRLAGWLRHL